MFCLFFVKQKTAYELRISDWSSDVCSSDLPAPNTVALRDAMVRGAAQLELDEIEIVGRGAFETGPADVMAAQAIILGTTENLGYMSGALKDFFDQIGGASCRERGYQYG